MTSTQRPIKNLLVLLLTASLLFGCNKLNDHPELVGVWGTSTQLNQGHTLLISDDGTGHPYESPCNGAGTLKVKVSENELLFKKSGSTRIKYIITTYPQTAVEPIAFDAQTGCIPVVTVKDTIYPGEVYMILNETIYLKKHP